LIYFDSILAI